MRGKIIIKTGIIIALGGALFWLGAMLPIEKRIVFLSSSRVAEGQGERQKEKEKEKITDNSKREIKKIWLGGDLMLDRGVEYKVKTEGGGDWRFPFRLISSQSQKADIFFINLEGPVSKRGRRQGSIYSFRFEPESIEGLRFAGVDVVSLANNHTLDYGREALLDTFENLKNNGIVYTGAGKDKEEAFSLKTLKIGENKVGFLAYTDMGSVYWQAKSDYAGLAWIDKERIDNVYNYIKKIKREKLADILIVSLHSGVEYSRQPTAFQKNFARSCINAGADIVAGHHPHITQPIEEYKNGYIAYSLGNFLFDQGFSVETMKGVILEAQIKDGKITKVVEKNISLNSGFQPSLIKNENE